MLLQNNAFRFGVTLLLALQYSLLRTTEYSIIVKPLPILFWVLIVAFSPKRLAGRWVVLSLALAAVGDILLDLGPDWLQVATLPFLGSTLILALAFHLRGREVGRERSAGKALLIVLPIAALAGSFHFYMAPLMGEAAGIGAVLMGLSALLIWASLSELLLGDSQKDRRLYRLAGFLGTCGIVGNYVLYSVTIGVFPVPRDLVIQLYYWGQAFAAWSFLRPSR